MKRPSDEDIEQARYLVSTVLLNMAPARLTSEQHNWKDQRCCVFLKKALAALGAEEGDAVKCASPEVTPLAISLRIRRWIGSFLGR